MNLTNKHHHYLEVSNES